MNKKLLGIIFLLFAQCAFILDSKKDRYTKLNDEVFDFIVDKAEDFDLGARGLRSICEAIMVDAMFELPSSNEKEFLLNFNQSIYSNYLKSEVLKNCKLINIKLNDLTKKYPNLDANIIGIIREDKFLIPKKNDDIKTF